MRGPKLRFSSFSQVCIISLILTAWDLTSSRDAPQKKAQIRAEIICSILMLSGFLSTSLVFFIIPPRYVSFPNGKLWNTFSSSRLTHTIQPISFYTPIKTSENQMFCDVSSEYRTRSVVWNKFISKFRFPSTF